MEGNHTKLNFIFLYLKRGVLETKLSPIIHISEGISSRARRFWEHGRGWEFLRDQKAAHRRLAVNCSLKTEGDMFVVSGPTASASPENLLEMQSQVPTPDALNLLLWVGSSKLFLSQTLCRLF